MEIVCIRKVEDGYVVHTRNGPDVHITFDKYMSIFLYLNGKYVGLFEGSLYFPPRRMKLRCEPYSLRIDLEEVR